MSSKTLTATVIAKQVITDDLMIIKIKPSFSFTFRPGQYCTVGINGTERPYSIVSAPHEEHIELFVELVRGGCLTPCLWKLNSGDVVNLRPKAKGVFTFDDSYENHLMIATVTGIAPILSMLRHSLHRGFGSNKFYVIHGASFKTELAYRNELEHLSSINHNIVYTPTVSRPHDPNNKTWEGQTGRANNIFRRCIENFSLRHEATLIYACGHPGMVDDVKAQAGRIGFRVKVEKYWTN